eukprot:CAMPEP_0197587316 /NCGR_PEP_ID=MMETSP1326-20131121/8985_1 /TAXON_ID=1155430 /ORGANISM="Genus nov. species nov., Strain RCC2288" /LENGTH=157 /DNA_ID=CAMNT_0043152027 /DNA_START=265 /DNA_END=737 /DNA_ORIENTATION=-
MNENSGPVMALMSGLGGAAVPVGVHEVLSAGYGRLLHVVSVLGTANHGELRLRPHPGALRPQLPDDLRDGRQCHGAHAVDLPVPVRGQVIAQVHQQLLERPPVLLAQVVHIPQDVKAPVEATEREPLFVIVRLEKQLQLDVILLPQLLHQLAIQGVP